MRQTLMRVVTAWTALPHGSESARRYRVRLAGAKETTLGFITAMSHPFCEACDRIRISADGGFYPCLMDAPAGSLMPAIRPAFAPILLDELLCQGLTHKALVHPANGYSAMIQLGG
jgi:cyclic pyranopterin phosphate synthase